MSPIRRPMNQLSVYAFVCGGLLSGCAGVDRPWNSTHREPEIPPLPVAVASVPDVLNSQSHSLAAPEQAQDTAVVAVPPAAYKPALAMEFPPSRGSMVAVPLPQVSQIMFPDDPRSAVSPVAFAADDCLPPVDKWRAELDEKINQLQIRTSELESQLQATQTSLQSVTAELEASRTEVLRLNQSLTAWQDKVRRMDADSRLQQEKDLQALDELASSLDQLLRKNRIASGVRRP